MEKKSIKGNTVYNMLKTFFSIIFPVITIPYINRVLLTENVGKITFSASYVSYFSLIASLGISTYAIRECSSVRNNMSDFEKISNQIFSINIITTIFSYILLLVSIFSFRKLESYRVIIVVQSVAIIANTLGADWINTALEDFKYITIRTIVFQIFSLLLMIVFVKRPEDYLRYSIISLLSSAGASLTNIWYRKKICNVSFTLKIDWNRHVLPILYLFVMSLAQNILNSFGTTMLGFFCDNHSVGIYGTAYKIVNIISQLVASLTWVVMPRMSLYFEQKDYLKINKLLTNVFGFNMLIGLPCVIGVISIAEDIILLVAGRPFIESASILKILMVGFAFSLFGGNLLGNAVLLPSKQEKEYMMICLFTASIHIVTNLVLIPNFGAVGAALSTVFSTLLITILLILKTNKNISIINSSNLLISPIIGCLCIVIICYLGKLINNLFLRVFVSVVGSVLVYFTIQIFFKNVLIKDLIETAKNKLFRT